MENARNECWQRLHWDKAMITFEPPMCSFRKWLIPVLVIGMATCVLAQESARTRVADGFDFPVGKPNAEEYYKARGFRPNGHLGEDWNGVGGGNSDLGDPVYAIAHGIVVFARDVRLGWGNVVILRHIYLEKGDLKVVDSLYGHLDQILVKENQQVLRGQQLGTIGTNRGMYPAHLHFEIRKNLFIGVNRTAFKGDFSNYYSPTEFIDSRRKLSGGGRSALVAINTFKDPRTFGPPSKGSAVTKLEKSTPQPTKSSTKKKGSSTFRVNRYGELESL